MKPTWSITLANGDKVYVQCDLIGVANNGELLLFTQDNPQQPPFNIGGYGQGEWKTYSKSNLSIQ